MCVYFHAVSQTTIQKTTETIRSGGTCQPLVSILIFIQVANQHLYTHTMIQLMHQNNMILTAFIYISELEHLHFAPENVFHSHRNIQVDYNHKHGYYCGWKGVWCMRQLAILKCSSVYSRLKSIVLKLQICIKPTALHRKIS